MNNNLVPTTVVDKNGRLTTVHRKPASPATSAHTIPSPVLSHVETQRESIVRLVVHSSKLANEKMVTKVIETVASFSPEHLPHVKAALEDENLVRGISHVIRWGGSERHVREAIRFLPHFGERRWIAGLGLVRSLHGFKKDSTEMRYSGLPLVDDYSAADEKTQLQCEALLKVTRAIDDCPYKDSHQWLTSVEIGDEYSKHHFTQTAVIEDERLVRLTLERYEDVALIVDAIMSRKTADYDVIGPMMENALGEGNL